jgi:AmpD protein
LKPASSWLPSARHLPSPNWDERPPGCGIELLVIHNISLPPLSFGGPWIEQFFLNRLPPLRHPYFREIGNLHVSAHLLIRRTGDLVQFVALDKRAWHAGRSCFRGRKACNDFSIGIELEGSDEIPYTPPQYQTLKKVTLELMERFPAITTENIVGHCHIAPGRKSDPGPAFDWQHYRALLEASR